MPYKIVTIPYVDSLNPELSFPINTILTNIAPTKVLGSKWLKCDGSEVSLLDYPDLKLPAGSSANSVILPSISNAYIRVLA